MGFLDRIFGRRSEPVEARASGSGFTAMFMEARSAHIAGRSGLGELTATVQACVSLWENGLSIADVEGTDLLDRQAMALCARSLALRGEAVFLIDGDRLIPAGDWDLNTRDSRPRAYRLSLPETGGARSLTALAPEVLHVAIGSSPAAPWAGSSPLRRSSLSAGLLHALESALSEIYETAPIGSQIVPMPENPEVDNEALGRGFRGQRGRVLLRESVHVTAAGGPTPAHDWRPAGLTPDLRNSMALEAMSAAREAIMSAFGVLPGAFAANATGPLVREAQRHLAGWTLSPIAGLIAQEATRKLGGPVRIDVMAPLQAFDAGLRARTFSGIIEGLAMAKAAGLSDEQVKAALSVVRLDRDED